MQPAHASEERSREEQGREASHNASRPTPLTLVSGAVAGDSLESVASAVATAVSSPVAIAIPALGAPVVSPPDSLPTDVAGAIVAHAAGVIAAREEPRPEVIADAVAIQIAEQVVGIVAALCLPADLDGLTAAAAVDRRAWLEAAAAAASVTALIRETHATGTDAAAANLLDELIAGPPADLRLWLARGRRLGAELAGGGGALSCRRGSAPDTAPLTADDRELIAELARSIPCLIAAHDDRVLAIAGGDEAAGTLAERLRDAGLMVARSAQRHDPAQLQLALLEAELLAELDVSELAPAGLQETYRLLIGVLLRDRSELEQLRERTVGPLSDYDSRHETELVATLCAFLSHDGSTTETADAMRLHRHTVGYRLSRVYEVSGLSPYESDGRERLSLGIKADRILAADRRLRACRRAGADTAESED